MQKYKSMMNQQKSNEKVKMKTGTQSKPKMDQRN